MDFDQVTRVVDIEFLESFQDIILLMTFEADKYNDYGTFFKA